MWQRASPGPGDSGRDLVPPGAVLAADTATTTDEVRALAALWTDGSVVGARGLWSRSSGCSFERAADPFWSRGGRVSVDTLLPGPVLLPAGELKETWPDPSESLDSWVRASRLIDDAGISVRCARLRPAFPHYPAVNAELVGWGMLPVTRRHYLNWRDISRVVLPFCERFGLTVTIPAGEHAAVVGPQRSGTTWLARSLGLLEGARTMSELVSFDVLIDEFLAPSHVPPLTVWQATFLTACSGLLRSLAESAQLIGVVRDPCGIVWSMLHNWPPRDLRNAGAVACFSRSVAQPQTPIELAALIVEAAWTAMIRQQQDDSGRAWLIAYEDLVRAPVRVLEALAGRLGRALTGAPKADATAIDHGNLLSTSEREFVRDRLGRLHQNLLAQCL